MILEKREQGFQQIILAFTIFIAIYFFSKKQKTNKHNRYVHVQNFISRFYLEIIFREKFTYRSIAF